MKKIRFGIFILAIITVFNITALAKTYKTDILGNDTVTYTLEEDDKLCAELFIDENGFLRIKLISISTTGSFDPKISISINKGSKEVYSFTTDKPSAVSGELDVEKHDFLVSLSEGKYELAVKNLTKFSDVSFTIETAFTVEENTEGNDNRSFENATEIDTGTKYYGGISMEKETDWFTFEMPYDGYAFFEMYSPELKVFSLYDENKREIGNIGIEIAEEDKVYSLRNGLAKGKYYISVSPEDDYVSPLYTIEVIPYEGKYFEKEFNNQFETATPVECGKKYQGNLFGIDDEDIFTFALTQDSGITIDFSDTHSAKKGHYSIWLSDGKEFIFTENNCGSVTKALNLEKGTYYFSVNGINKDRFTHMPYIIEVTADKSLAICPPEEDAGTEENEPDEKEKGFRFDDVNESSWYYNDIMEAYREGLVEGVPTTQEYDGHIYSPDVGVSIAETITMAVRAHSKKYGIEYEYALTGGKWYDFYVNYAKQHSIIEKDFDDYSRKATRAEVAYIFSNLFNDIETEKNTIIPDVDENTKYCNEIHKLYALGIFKGDDETGTFYPERNLTRAEAAVILLRVHNTK